MPIDIIACSEAPTAIGPYSQATVANGLVFVAGQVAFNPETMEIVGGGIQEQTQRVMQNLEAILQAAGSGLDKVVKTTVYLVDMADFPAMNEVYARAFGTHKPARATVAVSALPRAVRVEIEAIAIL